MDLRTEKTRRNIIEAFIKLRSTKPIEKITIKELADLAYINKATFYRHYEDIYALSDTIEDHLIDECVNTVTDTNTLLTIEGLNALKDAFLAQLDVFNIVFSGSRKDYAIHKVHDRLLDKIFSQYPKDKISDEKKVLLTTLIYGIFNAYQVHRDVDFDTITKCVIKLNSTLNISK